jgi:2-succinyl-6-hydroxy-2,4-cyclohexadiene-1-carboxylate synthase
MSSPPVLHYKCQGNPSAPPIVFLHGFMGSGQDWDHVIGLMSSSYYCLAVDLPGHGKSLHFTDSGAYAPDSASQGVVETMNRAGISRAAIVGYSMGGRLALDLAVHHGHACSALIVESATAGIEREKDRAKRRALDETWAGKLEQVEFEDFLRTWYRQPVFATVMEDEEKLEEVLRRRRANEPAELARALRGMSVGAQRPLWKSLPGMNTPVLLVAGEQDGKYVDVVLAMAALLRDAHVEIVPGAGHNVHLERPSSMAKHMDTFLQGVGNRYGND